MRRTGRPGRGLLRAVAAASCSALVSGLMVATPVTAPSAHAAPKSKPLDSRDVPGIKSPKPVTPPKASWKAPAGAPKQAPPSGPLSSQNTHQSTPRTPFDKSKATLESRSATTDTYLNPDGSETAEIHARPVNFQDASGVWHSIDNSLVTQDSTHLTNAAGAVKVTLSSPSTSGFLAGVSGNGWSIGFAMDGAIGGVQPTVVGDEAVYRGLQPGVDVHETVTGAGLKEAVVLNQPPSGGVAQFRFPLQLAGVTPAVQADGSIAFANAQGHVVATVPTAVVWDASGADPKSAARLTLAGSPGSFALVVSLDLTGTGWQYPVTIDPSFSTQGSTTSYDAYVASTNPTTSYNGSAQQNSDTTYVDKVGYDAQIHEWDSFQYFDMSAVMGKHILSGFWNDYVDWFGPASGQTTTSYVLWQTSTPWNPNTVTFNNRPQHGSTKILGAVTCAGCSVNRDMTSWVVAWAAGTLTNYGVYLDTAGSTSAGLTYFGAQENAGNGKDPYLSITYNTPPTVPVPSTPTNGATVVSDTPTLSASSSDPDAGQTLYYWFRVSTNPNGYQGEVANSGYTTAQTWTVPANSLQDGVTYYWIAYAYDGTDQTQSAPWSFTVNKRLGDATAAPMDGVGPAGVNLATGNVTVKTGTPAVNTVGGSMGVSFTYNSQAQRQNGLVGRYWGQPMTGQCNTNAPSVPTNQEPAMVELDQGNSTTVPPTFQFQWGGNNPVQAVSGTGFCVEWTGYITLPYQANTWSLGAQSDDGVSISIGPYVDQNGQTQPVTNVLSRWYDQGDAGPSGAFTGSLPFANYSANQRIPITIDYYQHAGGSDFVLWAGTGQGQVVPDSWLTPTQSFLPQGWTMAGGNIGPLAYTGLTLSHSGTASQSVQNDFLVLHDASGGDHPYLDENPGGSGGAHNWMPLFDGDAVITEDTSGEFVIQGDDGITYTFNSAGQLIGAVTSADDTNPSAAQYSIDPRSSELYEITDPVSGKTMWLTYAQVDSFGAPANNCPTNSSLPSSPPPLGSLCQISFPGGTYTNLYYNSNGQLARIENWAGNNNTNTEDTDFGYASNGLLSSVKDPLAIDEVAAGERPNDSTVSTNIVYDGYGRVSTITRPVPQPGQSAPETGYCYGATQASFVLINGQSQLSCTGGATNTTSVAVLGLSQPKGYARQVVLESAGTGNITGRPSDEYDVAGIDTRTTWNSADLPLTSTVIPGGQTVGLETTSVYDGDATYVGHAPNRLTDEYGPALSNCFTGQIPATPVPAGCPLKTDGTSAIAHVTTKYDEGMSGLAVTYWNTWEPTGTPAMHTTGLGTGSLYEWALVPTGLNATGGNWSMRLTGEINFATTGNYDIGLYQDGGTRIFVDDKLVADQWSVTNTGTNTVYTINNVAAGRHRIRVDYHPYDSTNSNLQISWAPHGQGLSLIPDASLYPLYSLTTTKTDADGKVTQTGYTNPHLGLATSTTTAAGTSTTSYDSLARKSQSALPNSGTTTSYTYYPEASGGPLALACGITDAIQRQGGLLEQETDPAPASGAAIVHQYIYDTRGRTVGTEIQGDANWSCISYDSRGRISQTTDSNAVATNVSYAPAGTTTTTFNDSGGHPRTTVSQVDLLGRVISYTDEQGTTFTTTYDQTGLERTVNRQFSGGTSTEIESFGYDTNNRLQTQTYYGTTAQTTNFAYDSYGRQQTLTRPNSVVTATGYDPNTGNVSSIQNQLNSVDLSPLSSPTYQYSPAGRVTQERTTGRTDSYTYDGAGRLIQNAEATTSTAYRDYAYDGDSNRCLTTTTATAPPNCTGTTYTYDNADRLISSPFASGYTYDSHGNLKSATLTNQPPATQTGTDSFGFDAIGNPTHTSQVIAGQSGTISASESNTTTPIYTTGTGSGSLTAGQSWSATIEAHGVNYVRANVTWTQNNGTYAPVSLQLKNSSGTLVASASGSAGTLAITYLTGTGENSYTLQITDTSGSTPVPSFSAPWSTTTSGTAALSGSVSKGSTSATTTLSASGAGYISIGLTYTQSNSKYANVTGQLKNASGTVVASASSSNGSLAFDYYAAASGTYTFVVVDNSTNIAVPSFSGTASTPAQAITTLSMVLKNQAGTTIASGSGNLSASGQPAGIYTITTTTTAGSGNVTLSDSYPSFPNLEVISYDGNDHATTIDDGTNTTTETLGPTGRVLERVVTHDVTGVISEDTIFGYAGVGDNAAYSYPAPNHGSVTTYVSGPSGLLLTDTAGTVSFPVNNRHGDIIGVTSTSGTLTANPTSDEFGVGTDPSSRLGWLGGKERFSTGGALGLIRMGERLYDPGLGRFLEPDPIPGGSANSYDYANQDPINGSDLSGQYPGRITDDVCTVWPGWICRAATKTHSDHDRVVISHSHKPFYSGWTACYVVCVGVDQYVERLVRDDFGLGGGWTLVAFQWQSLEEDTICCGLGPFSVSYHTWTINPDTGHRPWEDAFFLYYRGHLVSFYFGNVSRCNSSTGEGC